MHFVLAAILAVTGFAGALHTLVLDTGEHLRVAADVRIEESLVVFRAEGGSLYSIPLTEVDLPATEEANRGPRKNVSPAGPKRSPDQARTDLEKMMADRSLANRPIVVSEEEKQRLLEELKSSRGVPSPPAPIERGEPAAIAPSETVTVDERSDEWYWRDRSRKFKENVRRAQEDLQLLIDKEQNLQDEILGLLSLGYNPNQFNLQVLQLAHTRDSIPRARLALERAERAHAQFRDDARRQGILPGWLR